jgi:hypothetical protein
MDQLAPGSSVYNTPLFLRLSGDLEVAALKQALDSVVQRHEVLRTAFLSSGGRPRPIVLKKRSADLKQTDLRHLASTEREAEAMRLVNQESARPFDLARGPIARASLFQFQDREFIFLYVVHHIVFEGGSVAILFRDLAAYYNAIIFGGTPALPELKVEYSDFAAWQRRSLNEERLQTVNAYWRKRLADAPTIKLPLDFPRPPVHTMRGAKYCFSFSGELLSAAQSFFQQNATTSYRALCAAFNVLLYCYSGATDISLGTPCAPRCRGIEELIGFFVNTAVLRVEFSPEVTFRKLIRKVDTALHGALAHADLPFHKIVEAVQPPRDTSRTPLFQINFRAPQQPYPLLELTGISASQVQVLDNGTAKFDLALEVGAFANGSSYFEYCTDLLKETKIVQMASDFQALLADLVAHPDTPLSQLRMVAEVSQRACPQSAGALR